MAGDDISTKPRVVCVVPRGLNGKGGIERAFRYISESENAPADFTFLTTRGDGSLIASAPVFGWSVLKFAGLAFGGKVDLLHINLSMFISAYRKYVLYAIARLAGVPVVIHFHGGGFDNYYIHKHFWVSVVKHLVRNADGVIALGAAWRTLFVDVIGAPSDRVRVIYNAVPDFAEGVTKAPLDGRPLEIVFAGEVGRRKGVDVLVEGLAKLPRERNWRCTIAGNGDAEPFRSVLEAAGVVDRVTFTGWVDSTRIHELMLKSDIVVLPSRAEALPISLIEGAASANALVATPAGSSAEIVKHGECGLVIEESGESLANALDQLMNSPDRLRAMQAAARQHYLANFTMGAFLDRLTDLYADVLKSRASQASARA